MASCDDTLDVYDIAMSSVVCNVSDSTVARIASWAR